ncbi:MAG TPA: RES family NAD+ phosphorylase [Nocardioidaceae bacterium]|nr:RES family NAD+ phosphorylase [Nocardioidaceae bacterium]
MSFPSPPEPFPAPLHELLPEGSTLFRVHPQTLHGKRTPGNLFNPGIGPASRWAFFGVPVVPMLYAGETPEAAVFEAILHNRVPGEEIPARHWQSMVMTTLRTERALEMAVFHSDGLRRYGLHTRDLTGTPVSTYVDTVRWAEAVHDNTELDGVVWMARQFNRHRAQVFFGDRVEPDDLRPVDDVARDYLVPNDAEWLKALADRIDVTMLG